MDSLEGKSRKLFTLVFITKENQILLGLKKRGFGVGKWNGFGGKLMEGESIIDAAVRETQEECGLLVKPKDLTHFAVLYFYFVDDPEVMEVHVYKCDKFEGDVCESDEMMPKWYPIQAVPHDKMWIDGRIWYPLYVRGQKFKAVFCRGGYDTILRYRIVDYDEPKQILQEGERFPA